MGLRVEEYGKILTDGPITLFNHLFGTGTDDNPISIFDRKAKQMIADAAADKIGFHSF
jgi:hypothetical protein